MIVFALLCVMAYLFGSVSAAILLCKWYGLPDPRTQGSGNPGATNVLRIGKRYQAISVLILDALKGYFPVMIGHALGLDLLSLSWVAFSALLGHIYPLFFHFKGGKGVATLLGGLWGLAWYLGATWTIVWLVIAGIFRYSSLAALVATASIFTYTHLYGLPQGTWAPLSCMAMLVLFRHHSNVKKLIHGQESRIASGKSSSFKGQRARTEKPKSSDSPARKRK